MTNEGMFLEIINESDRPLKVDHLMIAAYRKFDKVTKRATANQTLGSLFRKGLIAKSSPQKVGAYRGWYESIAVARRGKDND